MKKHFYSLFAATAMMLAVTSCSQEEDFGQQSTGDLTTFSVVLQGAPQSRALGEGDMVDKLYYAVYDKTGATIVYPASTTSQKYLTADIKGGKVSVSLPLMKNQKYNIVFWAQNDGSKAYSITDLRNITINYPTDLTSNLENRDAFFNTLSDFTPNGQANTVELRRPFAQLNIGTSTEDWAEAERQIKANGGTGHGVDGISVKVAELANEFDAMTGTAEGDVDVEFKEAALVDGNFSTNSKDYKYFAMNYLLVPGTQTPGKLTETTNPIAKSNVDVEFTLYNDDANGSGTFATIKVPNAPIQRNYRTNIIGDFLTGDKTIFDVIVVPEFDGYYTSTDALIETFKNGGNVKLYSDLNLTDGASLVVPEGITVEVDMNGYTLTNSVKAAGAIINNGTLNIKNGTIYNGNIEEQRAAAIINTGNLTLTNVNAGASGNGESAPGNRGAAVQNEGGTITIKGGTFGTIHRGNKWDGFAYVFINNAGSMSIEDATVDGYPNGVFYATTGTIDVKGGSYTMQKGANTWHVAYAESKGTVHLLSGTYVWNALYAETATVGNVIVSENCITNWIASTTTIVTSQADFEAALANGGKILLGKNTTGRAATADYVWKSSGENATIQSFEIVAAEEGVVIDMDSEKDEYLTSNIDVAFNGVTLKFNNVNYAGFKHSSKETYTNCEIIGKTTLFATNATFNGCTFTQSELEYNVWTYGAMTADFNNCIFNSAGKSVLIYIEETGATQDQTVNFNNCTLTASSPANDGKAAIEVDSQYKTTGKYIVNINNTTATGFDAGSVSGNSLYNQKKGNKATFIINDQLNVVVNDEETFKDVVEAAGAAGAGNTTITITKDMDMSQIEWTPISVDGYHGADIVTVEGNHATIKGLTSSLFAGGFAGGSGIVIKDLTIDESTIIANDTQGYGAFVGCADSMDEITLINCHLKNSTIITPNDGAEGSRIGGLIGWTAGYNNQNDGPVDSYITVKDCSVTECTLKGQGSIGGIVGHAGANAATYTTIENCTISKNNFISTENGTWRVGVVVGTANNGQCVIKNITESENTLTQENASDTKNPTGDKRNYYGRFVPAGTGTLTIDGVKVVE